MDELKVVIGVEGGGRWDIEGDELLVLLMVLIDLLYPWFLFYVYIFTFIFDYFDILITMDPMVLYFFLAFFLFQITY